MSIEKVEAICEACNGTGLYEGFCEAKGHPVVCIKCDGTGCEVIGYRPFISRKIIKGVKSVKLSKGTFIITGVGEKGESVTYKEFLERRLTYKK
jgi:DnaJ-class molecular chaperone